MTSSDHPEMSSPRADEPATTGIQTPLGIQAPAEPPSIPLKPLPRRSAMTVERFTVIRGWLDGILVALVLIFAFLIASFPATNPDFFRQAATGRLLIQGAYHFGVDPFTFSGDQVYWVNHSWLFGMLMYALYQIPTIGGAVVVVFKALLVAALAEILLRTSRRAGQSLWIPTACTALAVLAVSPRLYLQSTCLSFLFLALTLWLLSTSRPDEGEQGMNGGKRIWWLPPLFALWANCDSWFILGPLSVALYLGGELIQWKFPPADAGPDESRGRRLKTLGLVLPAEDEHERNHAHKQQRQIGQPRHAPAEVWLIVIGL